MKRTIHFTLVNAGLLIVTAMLLQGCQSSGPGVAVTVSPGAAVPAAEYPDPKPPPSGPGSAEAAVRALNINVTTVALGEGTSVVKTDVQNAVEGGLVGRGFKINATRPEVSVMLQASASEFDSMGNFYVYKGDVAASVTREFDGKLMGKEKISVKGERTLDRKPALQALSKDLASETSAWVADTCTTAMSGLEALDVTVRRTWKKGEQAGYARKFVRTVKAFPGVVKCVVVGQAPAEGQIVFRVVYYKEQIPEGLLFRIAEDPGLNIEFE